jgi:hypothetical protein
MFSRIQLYLFIGAAFILGAVGIYASGVQRGIDRTQRRIDERRLDNMRTAKDVKDGVEVLDDVDLAARARRWVRKNNDR